VEAVRGALVRSSRSGKIFSGHGGVCRSGDKNLAWFVGHLKTRDGEYVFATNMESGPEIKAERAEAVTRSILEEMNLL
jgi:beta-lactamase class D